MLLMSAGSSFALAMGATGILTWALAHGHGLASFINNPAAATASYATNVTPGQLAWDLLDFGLTFIPGSALGAGGRAIARTTATDMAAARTTMRGGRQAAQTTERTAAKTEAQHIAESQAAHNNARQGARQHDAPAETKPDAEAVNEYADRGDGRDIKGRYAKGNGGAHMYDESEAFGLKKYIERVMREGGQIKKVIEDKRLARINERHRIITTTDSSNVRTAPGAAWKSRVVDPRIVTRSADKMASPDNPAVVKLGDGRTIEVAEVQVQRVPKQ